MKKQGFTLIELLAVIVILAIIALISSPIIIGIVDNVKKEAFKNSAYGIVASGKILFSNDLLNGINEEVIFTYNNGIESSSVSGKGLDYSGAKPQNGEVKVNKEGQVALAIHDGNYCAKKGYFDSETIVTEETKENCNIPLYADNTGSSIPELTTGMIPVIYDGTNWVKADIEYKWYDYNKQEWANAVTVNNAIEEGTGTDGVPRHSREYYINTLPAGSPISMDDINTMWVWIPRYKYAIPTGTGARSINIVFESKTTDLSTGNAVDTNYQTHPAFTFGTTEVSGIWVGKFETTGTIDNITILPNIRSLRSKTIKVMYEETRKMENNEIYGFGTDGNIHMAKDSEWGAVAYLSYSKYGKNSEVYINPGYNYVTGRGGMEASQPETPDIIDTPSNTLYSYDGKQCNTKTGYVCTGSSQKVYGMASSTTGNIYGVYDMSGGSWEFTMSMYRPTDGTTVTDNSGFGASTSDGGLATIDDKYWDRYIAPVAATACNGVCYGNALSETSGWYGDANTFMNASKPWLVRGAYNYDTTVAGIFAFYYYDGNSSSIGSYRIIQLKL